MTFLHALQACRRCQDNLVPDDLRRLRFRRLRSQLGSYHQELNSERQSAVSQCSHLFDLQNKSEFTCVGKKHYIFAVICTVRTLFHTSMQMCLKSNRLLIEYRQGRFTITLL